MKDEVVASNANIDGYGSPNIKNGNKREKIVVSLIPSSESTDHELSMLHSDLSRYAIRPCEKPLSPLSR